MRDLVETVIAQVLKQQPSAPQQAEDKGSFKRQFSDAMRQPVTVPLANTQHPDKALWDASVKFESMFLQQMMEAMRKTVPKSGFLPHGFAEGVQDSMFDQAISDAGGRAGNLGIASNIYKQLSREKASQDTTNQHTIQDLKKTADIEQMSKFTGLQGDIHGSH